jgi:hypothetical protein
MILNSGLPESKSKFEMLLQDIEAAAMPIVDVGDN